MAKLELAIALKLIQNNFNKGIDRVKSSLKSLQYQTVAIAGALGAGGFAISGFIGRLKDVARETNRANVALKNVSKSTSDYADQVNFVKELSGRYKQDLNNLTSSYAKFKAAADSAGLSIADQQKIFSSVTRSLTAFGLGGQDANLALMAVQQMMSKGKISSEELRRQLGERLPIAFEAMARAAGVSSAQLDKLLKDGKVRAADVLPKFAEELDKMIENVDTDNLETSFAQIGNTLIEIVDEWGLVAKFKSIVDKMVSLLRFLKDEGTALFVALGAGFLGSKMPNLLQSFTSQKAVITKAEKQHAIAIEQTALRQKALAEAQERYDKAKVNNVRNLATLQKRLANEQARYEKAEAAQKNAALELQKAKQLGFWGTLKHNAVGALGAIKRAFGSVFSSLAWGAVFAAVSLVITKLVEVVRHHIKINNLVKDYEKGIKNIDYGKQVSDLQAMLHLINNQKASEASKQGLLAQINKEYGYALTLNKDLAGQLEHQIQLLKQMEELRYHKEKSYEFTKGKEGILEKFDTSDDPEAPNYKGKIEAALASMKRYKEGGMMKSSPKEYLLLSKYYNDYGWLNLRSKDKQIADLSDEYKAYDQAHKRSLEHIAKTSQAQYVYQAATFNGTYDKRIKDIEEYDKKGMYANHEEFSNALLSEAQNALQRYRELNMTDDALLSKIKADIEKYSATHSTGSYTPVEDNNSPKKETPLQKAENEYKETITKLNNQKKNGLISEAEYQDALNDLSQNTAKEIAGILGDKAKGNAIYNAALSGIVKEMSEEEKALQQARKTIADTERRIELLGLSAQQAKEERLSAYNRALDILSSIDSNAVGHTLAISGYKAKRNSLIEVPAKEERDTTLDYKKSGAQITEEDLRLWEAYKEKLLQAQEAGLNVAKAIEEAQKEIGSLSAALKLKEIEEDIARLNKELGETTYSGVKQVADSTRHIVSAFKSMRNAFSDEDVDPFERLLNVFNALQQAVDGVLSVINMFQKIGEVSDALNLAKGAMAGLSEVMKGQGAVATSTAAAIGGVAVAETGAAAAQSAAASTEIALSKAVTSAKMEEMSAKVAAQHAALGPVGLATASAQIASFIALIKGAGATAGFASGGLVNYGSMWGDRTLIRVNKGERVLNSEQQEWLQGLAKGFTAQPQAGNVRVSGEFRMRAGELYAVVKQEERRRAR